MADIFISYAHEDRAQARKLVDALMRQGWTVWWDPEVVPGEHYDRVIQRALDAAMCIIVVWSRLSLTSDNVRNEAVVGRQRGRLIQVTLGGASYPSTFAGWQAVDLTNWTGDTNDSRFLELCRGVSRLQRSTIDLTKPQELIDAVRAALGQTQQNGSAATRESILAGPHGGRVRKAFESVCEDYSEGRTQRVFLPIKNNPADPVCKMLMELFRSPSKVSSKIQATGIFEFEFRG